MPHLEKLSDKFLFRRAGAPYFVRNVPRDLRLLVGKWQWAKRLPDDPIEARKQAQVLRDHTSRLIVQLRSREMRGFLSKQGGGKAVREALDILAVDMATATLLAEQPDWRADMAPSNMGEVAELLEAEDATRRAQAEGKRLEPIAKVLWEPTRPNAPTLRDIADKWLADIKPSASTVAKYNGILRRLYDVLGNPSIDQIKRTDVWKFRDHLAGRSLSHATIDVSLAVPHAMFAWAMARDLLQANPAAGVTAPKDDVSRPVARLPFSRTQLNSVTDRISEAWQGTDSLHAYRLTVYLGLRLREVTGLARGDLECDPDTDILVIRVRPNAYRSLKNAESQRILPVPSALAPDLLQHVKVVSTDGLLFPTLANASGLSKRFKAIVKECLGADASGALVWHSLRHSAEDHMRECIPDAFRYHLQGRAEPHGSARNYGVGPGLKSLAEWVEKLDPLGVRPTT